MNRCPTTVTVIIISCLCGCAQESDVTEPSLDNTVARSSRQSLDSQVSPEIVEKRIEYRDAMRRVVELLEKKYMHGSGGYAPLAKANIELAEAELAAAVTQAERHAALEKMLEQAKKQEDHARARTEAGAGGTDELALATAGRLRVELKLLEENYRLGSSASPGNSK